MSASKPGTPTWTLRERYNVDTCVTEEEWVLTATNATPPHTAGAPASVDTCSVRATEHMRYPAAAKKHKPSPPLTPVAAFVKPTPPKTARKARLTHHIGDAVRAAATAMVNHRPAARYLCLRVCPHAKLTPPACRSVRQQPAGIDDPDINDLTLADFDAYVMDHPQYRCKKKQVVLTSYKLISISTGVVCKVNAADVDGDGAHDVVETRHRRCAPKLSQRIACCPAVPPP
jgi:hypothetical protein